MGRRSGNNTSSDRPIFSPSIHPIIKIVVPKNEPVLYYLGSDDEYAPSREFVRRALIREY